MKKRLLSILLAVLILATALPLGFLVGAEGEGEGSTPPAELVVEQLTIVNNFPSAGSTLLEGDGYATSDPGASNDLSAYIASSTTEFDLTYLLDSGASDGAVKISYNAANASNTQNGIWVYRKGLPHAGANVIGIHIDATGMTNDPATAEDDYQKVLINLSNRSDVIRYFAAGIDYYFLSDEDGAVLETIENPTAANQAEAYVNIKTGASGYYFFPEEGFADVSAEVAGYEQTYANPYWTSFSDDWMQTDWIMNNGNFGNTYLGIYKMWENNFVAGGSMIVDNLCFATIAEKQEEEELPQYVVNRQNIVNNFPAEAGTYWPSWETSDPGANTNINAYIGSGTSEFQVSYVLESGAADGAAKISYGTASNTQSAVYLFRKAVPFKGANAIGLYIDATAFTDDPSTTDDDYIKVLIGLSNRSDVYRSFASGINYYFLSDEDGAVLETVKNPKAANDGEAYINIRAGKAGYYYFPEEGFCDVTADVAGFDKSYSNPLWTSFSDNWMQTEWVMDNGNWGSTYLSIYKIQREADFAAGGYLLVDNLCFAAIGEPEAPRVLPLKPANTILPFDTEKDTSVVTTWEHNNNGKGMASFTLVGDTDKSMKMDNKPDQQNYAVFAFPDSNNKYVPDANGIMFHVDGTELTTNMTIRISFKSGAIGNQIWFGSPYYFLEDGKPESEYEEKLISGSGQYSTWLTLFAGKSGTYFIPLSAFEIPEGYNDFESSEARDKVDFKVADRVNKSVESITFQVSCGPESAETFYIDDIGYTTADGSWVVPPQDPFPYMYYAPMVNLRNGELLADKNNGVGTVSGWGTITPEEDITFSNNRAKIKFGKYSTTAETAISLGAQFLPCSHVKAFSITIDASKVGSDMSIRATMSSHGGWRNIGGNGVYYLIPADGGEYQEKALNGERFEIPAGFKGTVVLPLDSFGGNGSDELPARPTGKFLGKGDGVSLSLYIFDVTSRNNTLVIRRVNYMTDNDGTGPITGVEDYTIPVICLLVAAAFVATVSVKKGLKVVED